MEDYALYIVALFPTAGLCLLVWGILWRSRVKEKLQSYASIEGTVIGTEVSRGDSTAYHLGLQEMMTSRKKLAAKLGRA